MFSLSVKGVLRKALDEQYIKIDVFTFVNICIITSIYLKGTNVYGVGYIISCIYFVRRGYNLV